VPPSNGNDDDIISQTHGLTPVTAQTPKTDSILEADIQVMLDLALKLKPVTVAQALRNPHHLVAAMLEDDRKIESTSHQWTGPTNWRSKPTLTVALSKALEPRAFRFMDAIIKRVEKIGGHIRVQDGWRGRSRTTTVVQFAGEDVCEIRLRERHKQALNPKYDEDDFMESRTMLVPTGLLLLDDGWADKTSVLCEDKPGRHCIEDKGGTVAAEQDPAGIPGRHAGNDYRTRRLHPR